MKENTAILLLKNNICMKFKVFILLFFLSFFIQSQKKESINIDRAIGVSCFFSGEPTAIINYFYDLIDTSDFNKIKRELFSNKPENKLVSLIILE